MMNLLGKVMNNLGELEVVGQERNEDETYDLWSPVYSGQGRTVKL